MSQRTKKYDNLQLRIDRDSHGHYRVLALAPGGRTGRGAFDPPITDDELDRFVRKVGLVRQARRRRDDRMVEIKALGAKLYDALIKDEVASVFDASRGAAHENGRGLRLTLHLSGAPELMRLPWEFLYKRPRFLSQSVNTPVVRCLDLASSRHPKKLHLPLQVLGMVSAPSGYAEIDADEERRKLETALSPLTREGLVRLEWLEGATLGELATRINQPDDIHVLHYIGHGAYDEEDQSGILVLETARGRPHDVSGEKLASILQDEDSLRLVVLNSCEGARTSRVDPFSGVATALLEFDIPAVIGMQFEITDEAAIAFSNTLYSALAQGLPIDAAVAPARRAIVVDRETEFGTPVLFLRAVDAHLFDIAEISAVNHLVTELDHRGDTEGIHPADEDDEESTVVDSKQSAVEPSEPPPVSPAGTRREGLGSREYERVVKSARALMDRGDNYQAISELQPALDRSNDAEQRALLLDLIGLCHAEEDEFAEALEFYEQALQEKPDDHVALVNMGIVYRLTDRFDKADECYRAALEIQPDYAELHASIGSLRIHQNRLADAALHLENALRLDDSLAVAHANLALAYARLGRREEADAELAKAMDRGYANGEALRGLMGRS